MQHSEQIDKLAEALAKAQGAFGPLVKDRTVKVRMKAGGEYSFDYATLDAVISLTRPHLAANGLAILQGVAESANGGAVDTMLAHSSGQWIKTTTPFNVGSGDNINQARGAAISYARRYAAVALLNLAADEDSDDNSGDAVQAMAPRAPAPPKSPPGISVAREKCNAACAEIESGGDWDAVSAYLNGAETKKLAVMICRDFPSLWRGTEPGSGLAGRIEVAGDQTTEQAAAAQYIAKVEEVARKAA